LDSVRDIPSWPYAIGVSMGAPQALTTKSTSAKSDSVEVKILLHRGKYSYSSSDKFIESSFLQEEFFGIWG